MIWKPDRARQQRRLVADLYERAVVPCQRRAVLAGGLPGADKAGALRQEGISPSEYLVVSVAGVLQEMAARSLIPVVSGLSPMEAADLAHAEAQFVAKRVALRALADGRNVILDISMASELSVTSWLATLRSAGYTVSGVFVDLPIEEAVRRAEAAHRRGEADYRRGVGHGGRYIPPEAIRALAGRPRPGPPASTDATVTAAAGTTMPEGLGAGPLAGLIAAYRSGAITLGELARTLQTWKLPAVPSACPPGLQDASAAIDDLEPYVPGSFDDIVRAYDLGELTDADYATLATALTT